ncbi:hypothetical protein AJ79_08171 [Helicocarpus griseus UAMH5409]|uniref:Fe2OG dioxygenase domain-containing protein n=1 Tax=Helicocarpus griseus UAMH5409 TaxID=1447875 RepID=A0A2B7WVU7_9EURO|nr:hypothetical protein AJ79_08171 [Helicocarpus griseus UAMH5409]
MDDAEQDGSRRRSGRKRKNPPPPTNKPSEQEIDKLVWETMITDSKLDACLDKFFVSCVGNFSGNMWTINWGNPNLGDNCFKDPTALHRLREQLVRDIEHLVPGYYEQEGLASASSQQKFDHLKPRYEHRYYETWKKSALCYPALREPKLEDDFLASIQRSQGEKRAKHLIQALSLSSGEASSSGGTSSLVQTCSKNGIRELQSAVKGEESTAIFAYGGSVEVVPAPDDHTDEVRPTPEVEMKGGPEETAKGTGRGQKQGSSGVDAESEEEGGSEEADGEEQSETGETSSEAVYPRRQCPPVRVFWTSTKDGKEHKTIVPSTGNNKDLEKLVGDCAPATFGRGGKDVLDPEYRRAGKLDPEAFCTSFYPAGFERAPDSSIEGRTVQDECMAYSGPSGHFKAHVDTPRSEEQFGSLVVCLPSSHKGGNLSVRHDGQVVDFDWSNLSWSHIQWAAFYSDCEHEIADVTSGHRLTLTYNLYIDEMAAATSPENSLVDPSTFPLYDQLKALLELPGFFSDGGVLGFFCSHSYAHTTESSARSMTRLLKGSDMAIFAVLKALGIDAKVRPVLERNGKYFGNEFGLDIPNAIPSKPLFYLSNDEDDEKDGEIMMGSFRESGQMKMRGYSSDGKENYPLSTEIWLFVS